jgi:hypothetical protein
MLMIEQKEPLREKLLITLDLMWLEYSRRYEDEYFYRAIRRIIEKYGNFGKQGHDVDEFYPD